MKRYTVGRITAPQGVRGAVRLQPLTDFPERFFTMEQITLVGPKGDELTFQITNCSELTRGLLVLTLEGIADRNAAETLRGYVAKVAADERMPLAEGQFWIDDLIGLTVVDLQGQVLGRVIDVTNMGASDLFEVETPQGTAYVPFVDQFVKKVDLSEGQLVIEPMEGLLP